MVESSHDGACRRIPQRPGTWDDVTVGYWLTKYTLGITLRILFRSRAWGVKNVPRRGPVILAGNHLSFSDHFFGPFPVPRKVTYLGKSEYFTGRGLKGLISRAFFTGVGVIPLDRAGGPASEQAIRTGLQVLAAGKVLRTITDEIMQAIAKLSGQEYVDIDARRAKADLAADKDKSTP